MIFPRQTASARAARSADHPSSSMLQQHRATRQSQATGVPPIVHEVLGSSGQPLDQATRAFMEPRFGHDFSRVRVHSDSRAAESARAVHARAYAVGLNVVFGANEYAPGTHHGRRLLAHELAHTIQQRSATGTPPSADPRGAFESSAEAAGRDIANGSAVVGALPACGVGLSRELDPWAGRAEAVAETEARRSRFAPGGFTNLDIYGNEEAEKEKEEQSKKEDEKRRHDRFMLLRRDLEAMPRPKNWVKARITPYPRDQLILRFFGLKWPTRWTKQLTFNKQVIEAINDYEDDWKKKYAGGRAQTLNPLTDDDVRAQIAKQKQEQDEAAKWEGYSRTTESVLAGAGASITKLFTDDPKKIAAGAGMGSSISGVLSAFADAKANRYAPEVELSASDLVWRLRYSGPARTVEPTVASPPLIPAIDRPTDVTQLSEFQAQTVEPAVSMKLPEPAVPATIKQPPRGRRIIVPPPQKGSRTQDPARDPKPSEKTPPEIESRTRPETGAEMEKRLLGSDKPQRVPTDRYFGWEGGSRGTFGSFADALRQYSRVFNANIPRLNRKVLRQSTRAFIASTPVLQELWDAQVRDLTDQAARIHNAIRNAAGDKIALKSLQAQETQVQNQLARLNDWANAPVQNKRPDLVEVWPAETRAAVTDITQRPFDPSHNFKIRFYIEVIRALTGWSNVSGLEFQSPRSQQPIE